jgi:hypothetical protein
MRIAPVLATMLFGLFCSGARALDDTPTHAPYLQAKGEDGRAAIRPAGVGVGAGAIAAIGAGKRDVRPVATPRAAAAGPAPTPVPSRPAAVSSAIIVEKPIWKLQ